MARWLSLLVCGALATALGVPAPSGAAAGAGRADLVVASVGTSSSTSPGARLVVRVKVRNGGTARAGTSTTTFRLSTDRSPGGDAPLKPGLATPAVSPGRSWSGKATLTVPAATTPGTYYVLACADGKRRVRERNEGNNCRSSAGVAVAAPLSSHDLIDADVANHTLSAEQGLVYKVFSDFADPRLPARYAAAPGAVEEGALQEASEQWESLSPTGQDTLRPFLVPPFYPGSHWTPVADDGRQAAAPVAPTLDAPWCSGSDEVQPAYESWDHLDTAAGNFRIWWLADHPGDATTAARLAGVLEAPVLTELVKLMGHSYKPDGGGFCDGGSGAVDIAIVGAATANTYADDASCGAAGTSTHMIWPRTKPAPWADIEPYLAHEVMHMIQLGMPVAGTCARYAWLREMTAEWVQDYVTDPQYGVGLAPDDTEHLAAPLLLDRPNVPLDSAAPPKHDYGAYLFNLWNARHGDTGFAANVWANARTMGPTEAVDAALPGEGFTSVWPEFALANWNRGPVDDYKAWDQLTVGAKSVGPEPVPVGERQPSVHVEHLAAQYLTLDIDPGVTELEITNDLAGEPAASLQAVIEYDDGSHAIVNMSSREKTTLCIDDGSRRATSVVLIFANADQTHPLDFAPTLVGSASCGCPTSTPTAQRAAATCVGNVTLTWTEDIVDEKPEGIAGHTTVEGSGTLGLAFRSPTAKDPATYWVDPSSTYTITRHWYSESYRACGTETGDVTDTGSGNFEEEQTFAVKDPDATGSEEVGLSTIFVVPTHSTQHYTHCGIPPTDSVADRHLGFPACPPTNAGGYWWKLDPVAPGSDTYRIDCSGTFKWEDGLGKHTITATVSGTVTLP